MNNTTKAALSERPSSSPTREPGAAVAEASAHLSRMLREEPHRLRRRSISLGIPVVDADDAAQNAALRAWRSLSSLRSPDAGPMCAWLDAIVRTTVIDMQRARKDDLGEVLCERLQSPQDVEHEAEVHEHLAAVLRAIEDLPPQLRRPLELSAVDELSAEQIGERLGITPAAVRQRISRARRALRG
ncbi:RNA polymerase sigma factor [Microbacterium sp. NPDC055903]